MRLRGARRRWSARAQALMPRMRFWLDLPPPPPPVSTPTHFLSLFSFCFICLFSSIFYFLSLPLFIFCFICRYLSISLYIFIRSSSHPRFFHCSSLGYPFVHFAPFHPTSNILSYELTVVPNLRPFPLCVCCSLISPPPPDKIYNTPPPPAIKVANMI